MLKKHNIHGPMKWFAGVLAAAGLLLALPAAQPVYAAGDTGSSDATAIQTSYVGFSAVSDIVENDVSVRRWGYYHVAFDGNGGNGSMASMEYQIDESKALEKNVFKRTGYTFTGWNTKPDGSGDSFSDGQSVENLAESSDTENNPAVTLYAQWEANTYTLTLVKGQGIDSVTGDGSYKYGSTVSVRADVNSKYEWAGWTVVDGDVDADLDEQTLTFTMPAGNLTLRAGDASGDKSHQKVYTATYHDNLHDGLDMKNGDDASVHTHVVKDPKGVTRSGDSFSQSIYADPESDQNEAIPGCYSWEPVTEGKTTVFNTGTEDDEYEDMLSTGEYFDGWNTKPNGSGKEYKPGDKIPGDGNIDLYAQWTLYVDTNLNHWEKDDDMKRATVTVDYDDTDRSSNVSFMGAYAGWEHYYTVIPTIPGRKYSFSCVMSVPERQGTTGPGYHIQIQTCDCPPQGYTRRGPDASGTGEWFSTDIEATDDHTLGYARIPLTAKDKMTYSFEFTARDSKTYISISTGAAYDGQFTKWTLEKFNLKPIFD